MFPLRGQLRKKVVLFLCTGNTCRSPMAAGYFRKLLADYKVKNIEVRSAGVMTVTGLRASPEATNIMNAEAVDLSKHRSTVLTPEIIRKCDLILGMSPLHVQTAVRLCEESRHKAFLLKEYTGSDPKNIQIADPMGCTLEVFKKCLKEIKAACDLLVKTEFVAGLTGRKATIQPPLTSMALEPPRPPEALKAAPKPSSSKPAVVLARPLAPLVAKPSSPPALKVVIAPKDEAKKPVPAPPPPAPKAEAKPVPAKPAAVSKPPAPPTAPVKAGAPASKGVASSKHAPVKHAAAKPAPVKAAAPSVALKAASAGKKPAAAVHRSKAKTT